MKRILLSTFLAGLVTANIHAMDLSIPENKFIDGMVRSCVIDTYLEIADLNAYDDNRIEVIRVANKDKYSDSIGRLRQNNNAEQWTLKKLKDSVKSFFNQNGLNDFFDKLLLRSIEVTDLEQAKTLEGNGIKLIGNRLEAADKDARYRLFHDEKYEELTLGTNQLCMAECFCDYGSEGAPIGMNAASEEYDTIFIHESGHCYHFNKSNNFVKIYSENHNFDKKIEAINYAAGECVAWTFEFRDVIEKFNNQELNHDAIYLLANRLGYLMQNKEFPFRHYFINLSLSLASQTDKPLVDIADQLIKEIDENIYINGDSNSIRTDFLVISDAQDGGYGIDPNGVIRFNAEKNKALLKNILTSIGCKADNILDNVNGVVENEMANLKSFINGENASYIKDYDGYLKRIIKEEKRQSRDRYIGKIYNIYHGNVDDTSIHYMLDYIAAKESINEFLDCIKSDEFWSRGYTSSITLDDVEYTPSEFLIHKYDQLNAQDNIDKYLKYIRDSRDTFTRENPDNPNIKRLDTLEKVLTSDDTHEDAEMLKHAIVLICDKILGVLGIEI